MSVLQTLALSADAVKLRWREPYTSSAVNKRGLARGRGVYEGFIVAPGVNGGLWVDVNPDSASGLSIAFYRELRSGRHSPAVVLEGPQSINLAARANQTVYLALSVAYAISADSTAEIRVVDAAELALDSQLILLARVQVPAAGPIPAANINRAYRTTAGDEGSALTRARINLIPAAGFEGEALAAAPSLWSVKVNSGSPVFTVDSTFAKTGSRSLKVVAAVAADGVAYSPFFGVQSGEEYQVGAAMRSVGGGGITGAGRVQLEISFYDAAHAVLGGSPVAIDAGFTGAGTAWTDQKGLVTAPAGAVYARAAVHYQNVSGTVYVDEIECSTRGSASAMLLGIDRQGGRMPLPLAFFTSPEQGRPNRLFQAGQGAFTAAEDFLSWASGGLTGALAYVKQYAKGWYTPAGGALQVGGVEGGNAERLVARLDKDGASNEGQLTLGDTDDGSTASMKKSQMGTLVGGAGSNADSLHRHDAASVAAPATANMALGTVSGQLANLDANAARKNVANTFTKPQKIVPDGGESVPMLTSDAPAGTRRLMFQVGDLAVYQKKTGDMEIVVGAVYAPGATPWSFTAAQQNAIGFAAAMMFRIGPAGSGGGTEPGGTTIFIRRDAAAVGSRAAWADSSTDAGLAGAVAWEKCAVYGSHQLTLSQIVNAVLGGTLTVKQLATLQNGLTVTGGRTSVEDLDASKLVRALLGLTVSGGDTSVEKLSASKGLVVSQSTASTPALTANAPDDKTAVIASADATTGRKLLAKVRDTAVYVRGNGTTFSGIEFVHYATWDPGLARWVLSANALPGGGAPTKVSIDALGLALRKRATPAPANWTDLDDVGGWTKVSELGLTSSLLQSMTISGGFGVTAGKTTVEDLDASKLVRAMLGLTVSGGATAVEDLSASKGLTVSTPNGSTAPAISATPSSETAAVILTAAPISRRRVLMAAGLMTIYVAREGAIEFAYGCTWSKGSTDSNGTWTATVGISRQPLLYRFGMSSPLAAGMVDGVFIGKPPDGVTIWSDADWRQIGWMSDTGHFVVQGTVGAASFFANGDLGFTSMSSALGVGVSASQAGPLYLKQLKGRDIEFWTGSNGTARVLRIDGATGGLDHMGYPAFGLKDLPADATKDWVANKGYVDDYASTIGLDPRLAATRIVATPSGTQYVMPAMGAAAIPVWTARLPHVLAMPGVSMRSVSITLGGKVITTGGTGGATWYLEVSYDGINFSAIPALNGMTGGTNGTLSWNVNMSTPFAKGAVPYLRLKMTRTTMSGAFTPALSVAVSDLTCDVQ